MKSPLNYLGGKSRLAKQIIENIPDHTCYCEPFCGAAWVLFTKEPSNVEVINDLNKDLITFYRVLQNHLEEFLRYYKFSIVSRELFDIENKRDPDLMTDIQRAVRFYYLQRLSYAGKTKGRHMPSYRERPPSLNISNLEESLVEVHWRMKRIVIERMDAIQFIKRYDKKRTFFYIDPPYFNHEKDYAVTFERERFEELRDVLKHIQGRFILSLNDLPEIREIYKCFKQKKVTLQYSAGKQTGSRSKPRFELFIFN